MKGDLDQRKAKNKEGREGANSTGNNSEMHLSLV